MTVFAYICAYIGVVLFGGAVCGLNNARAGEDQHGRGSLRTTGLVALAFITVALVLGIAGRADAQVQMWPGQEIQFCNGIGAISGGGTVCKHNITDERIELTFMNRSWHTTFWGDGTAASLLPPLCRISNVHRVTETVFEPGLVRVRTIPCSTGRSGPWIVVEVPKS